MSNDPKDLPVREIFKLGGEAVALSFLVLFFGGLAHRAYSVLRYKEPEAVLSCGLNCDWVKSLLVFAVCGAVTVGTILFAWRLSHPKRSSPGWGLAAALLAVVLFGLLVWPTPWTYREYGCEIFQINRFVGSRERIARLPCEPEAAQPVSRASN